MKKWRFFILKLSVDIYFIVFLIYVTIALLTVKSLHIHLYYIYILRMTIKNVLGIRGKIIIQLRLVTFVYKSIVIFIL